MKERMKTTLGQLQEDLFELQDDLMGEMEEVVVFEEEGEELMTVENMVIVISELDIQLRCGTMYLYCEEDQEYMADWSLTAIYDINADYGDYITFDQYSPIVSVYNYFHGEKSMDELESMECIVKL